GHRLVEGHRLLDLVDEIRQRPTVPVREETVSDQRGAGCPFHRGAVAAAALDLVNLLSARRLPGGVHTFCNRSQLRDLRRKRKHCGGRIDARWRSERVAQCRPARYRRAHHLTLLFPGSSPVPHWVHEDSVSAPY